MKVVFNKKQLYRCFFSFSSAICEKASNPKPTLTHIYSSISSNGSHSIRSFSVLIDRFRIRVYGKTRSFSASSSDCENRVVIGSSEFVLQVNNVDNVSKDKTIFTHPYSSIFANGSRSIRSFSFSIYRFQIGIGGKTRSFSASSFDFKNRVDIDSDEYVMKVNNVGNVSKDNSKLVNGFFDDDVVTNASSEVSKVDEGVVKADSELVYQIVEAIKNSKNEKSEKEIVPKGKQISTRLVNEIFRVLNNENVSGLPFVAWAQDKNPKLFYKADFQSLITDNCGWLGDYDAMLRWLEGFSAQGVSLTEKAFGFFASLGMDEDLIMVSIRKVISLLNKVGGSCRGTGIVGLIKMLCKLDLIDMAMFVIQITEKKLSYYNIIVRENCIRLRFDKAIDLVEEMRKSKCDPNALSYTYILSSLCTNGRIKEALDLFDEMEKKDCEPDALSFEIIILSMCKLGKMNIASKYFGHMVNKDLEPRVNTNTALIKGYFNLENYEEAHNFVLNLGISHKSCGNSAYSLLVSLHFGKGDVVTAGKLLVEMMDKNFIPPFTLCKSISKQLFRIGDKQMANDIKVKFSQLRNGIELRLGPRIESDSVVR